MPRILRPPPSCVLRLPALDTLDRLDTDRCNPPCAGLTTCPGSPLPPWTHGCRPWTRVFFSAGRRPPRGRFFVPCSAGIFFQFCRSPVPCPAGASPSLWTPAGLAGASSSSPAPLLVLRARCPACGRGEGCGGRSFGDEPSRPAAAPMALSGGLCGFLAPFGGVWRLVLVCGVRASV